MKTKQAQSTRVVQRHNPELARQQALALHVGRQFHDTDQLVPAGRNGSFSLAPMGHGIWCGETPESIAWWALAHHLTKIVNNRQIIDHAWLMRFADRSGEHWALVTEPYMDPKDAEGLPYLAADAMPGWFVDVHVLEPAWSAWNPGECLPIIATFQPGRAEAFIRQAMLWALQGPLA